MSQPVCVVCGGPISKLSEGDYLKGIWEHALAADCVAFCRKPGFSRNPASAGLTRVTVTLEEKQWEQLLWALGIAVGAALRQGLSAEAAVIVRLTNAINVGNSNFDPYEVEPEATPNA
jgi:hypothetical protein